MKLKSIIIIFLLVLVIFIALFGFGIREFALKGIINDVPEYNCGEGDVCSSCVIKGNPCNCGTSQCTCGNMTVDKKECDLFG